VKGMAVLVSQTVRDLVAGSGATFESAGEYELKVFLISGCYIGCQPIGVEWIARRGSRWKVKIHRASSAHG